MLFYLLAAGTFSLFSKKIHRLGFFGKWPLWQQRHLIWQLIRHNRAMQEFVGNFRSGHKVRVGMVWKVVRNDHWNWIPRMKAMSWTLGHWTTFKKRTEYWIGQALDALCEWEKNNKEQGELEGHSSSCFKEKVKTVVCVHVCDGVGFLFVYGHDDSWVHLSVRSSRHFVSESPQNLNLFPII